MLDNIHQQNDNFRENSTIFPIFAHQKLKNPNQLDAVMHIWIDFKHLSSIHRIKYDFRGFNLCSAPWNRNQMEQNIYLFYQQRFINDG